MSDKRTILSDPLQIALGWPGLKTRLFDWIDDTKPNPWDEQALHNFLSSYGLEVEVGPLLWRIRNEAQQEHRVARVEAHENGTIQAYSSALDWLQRTVLLDEELHQIFKARNQARVAQSRRGAFPLNHH